MAYSEAAALSALSAVTDPVTGRDLVASGRVAALDLDGERLRLTLRVDPDKVDAYARAAERAETVLVALDGVREAQIVLTAHRAAPEVRTRRGQPHQPRRPDGYQGDAKIRAILAVSSAKGGVGKSTVAFNLAAAFARAGLTAGVLDADIHGPSLPSLSATQGASVPTRDVEGRKLMIPVTAHGLALMSIAYLTPDDGPVVWRGPMVQGAMTRMLWDTDWGDLDVLVIDMPPGTGDPQLGLAQDIKPHPGFRGALIVTTPQDLALLDARKGRQMFEKVGIDVLGVVENMATFICQTCGTVHHPFGEGNEDELDLDVLARLPLAAKWRASGSRAGPVESEAMDGLAGELLARLDLQPG